MERVVNVGRGHHAVAPPSYGTQSLSKEERHQLRVVRHNAFIRHQQNAAWMQELLDLEEGIVEEEEEADKSAIRNQVIEILTKKINEIKENNTNTQKEMDTKSSLHQEQAHKFHEKMKSISSIKDKSEYTNFKSKEKVDPLPFMTSNKTKNSLASGTTTSTAKKIVSL